MTIPFLALAAMLLGHQPVCPAGCGLGQASLIRVDDDATRPSVKAVCAKLFHAMNEKREGIFHEDISSAIAPYFPPGQPIAETRKVIAAQHLGDLQPFMGKPMPGEGAPFATSFHLMGAEYSQVEVVLHIDFKGDNESNYVVHSVHAYFRGTSM